MKKMVMEEVLRLQTIPTLALFPRKDSSHFLRAVPIRTSFLVTNCNHESTGNEISLRIIEVVDSITTQDMISRKATKMIHNLTSRIIYQRDLPAAKSKKKSNATQ